MGTQTRCYLCGENITYNSNDTSSLINHMKMKHSNTDVMYYDCENFINPSTPLGPLGPYGDGSNGKKFKTTVETWNQGPTLQKCPYCLVLDAPLIRKQRNKIARTSLGAMLLLGCWPLCFLPFILGGSDVLNLYCKHCGNFIASYDRKNGCISNTNPNKKLIHIPNIC